MNDMQGREIVDGVEWNRLVLQLPGAALEQGWEWGEVLRESGWVPRRLAIFHEGRCVAGVSLGLRSFAGHALLYACRGPLVDWKNRPAVAALTSAVRTLARGTPATLLRVSPGAAEGEPALHDALVSQGFIGLDEAWTVWNAPRIVMAMPLTGNEERLRLSLSKSRRAELASAARAGITVRAGSLGDVPPLFALLAETGRRKGFPVRGRRHFVALWRAYAASGQGALFLAERGGRLLGGLFGARLGVRASFLYAAVDRPLPAGLHPAAPLYWELMRWARAQGCESLAWGGSSTRFPPHPDDPGYGVYQFKRSFGAMIERLVPYYDLPLRPILYRAFRAAERQLSPLAWKLRATLSR